jgi:hypothetical protein
VSDRARSGLVAALWARPADWRVVVLRAVLVHALIGWVYIAMNSLSHPWTLDLRLTHFSNWPHEGDFGAACFVIVLASAWLLGGLTGAFRESRA